jgi:hypothetical protein
MSDKGNKLIEHGTTILFTDKHKRLEEPNWEKENQQGQKHLLLFSLVVF